MAEERLRLLVLGAHPDDAEFHAAGLCSLYCEAGHEVRMISATDGSAGHHLLGRAELAKVRKQEAAASAALIGATSEVWEFVDGELEPTLELRRRVIGAMRSFGPDLVLTHRTNDYHPDHRALGQAVQDASFMVRVPAVESGVAALEREPVVAFMADMFNKPCPMEPDIVLKIDSRLDTVAHMLAEHKSQMFEWLPFLYGIADQVPKGDGERLEWLKGWYAEEIKPRLTRCGDALREIYGSERAETIGLVEMFEISQYAAPLTETLRQRLFSWV